MMFDIRFATTNMALVTIVVGISLILICYFMVKYIKPVEKNNIVKTDDRLLKAINSKIELLTLINMDIGKKLHDFTCEDCNAEETEETEKIEETDIKESDNETK